MTDLFDRCKAQRTADPPQDCDWPFCGCDRYATKVLEAVEESGFVPPQYVKDLEEAFTEALKLQSHYALLLNMQDGGQRRTFSTVREWIERLTELKSAGATRKR